MRVLVASTAGSGHFGPLVPFARAAAAAGHEVAVAAPGSFAKEVSAAGFVHLPFADPPEESLRAVFSRIPAMSFDEADTMVVSDVFGRIDARAALPGLLEVLADWRPDLVLRDPAEFGSLAAAARLGVPQAAVAIGVRATMDYIEPLVEEPLSELDELAGLPAGTCSTALRSTPVLACVPEILDAAEQPPSPGAGRLHRFRDDALPRGRGRVPEPWGDPSLPLVYITFGSVAGGLDGYATLHASVVTGFGDQPVRVLLTTGHGVDPADLPPSSDNIRVERWWPQAEVMPYAAAAVGHGGFGTTLTALAAGVPQVLLPLFSRDQHINAARVSSVGAGLRIDGGVSAVASLPGAITRLLADETYRSAARAVADEIAQLPPVHEAVPVMEAIAAAGRSVPGR